MSHLIKIYSVYKVSYFLSLVVKELSCLSCTSKVTASVCQILFPRTFISPFKQTSAIIKRHLHVSARIFNKIACQKGLRFMKKI